MNRNKDGTELTIDDLAAIALSNSILTEETLDNLKAANHNADMFRSVLLDKTKEVRLKMFMAGKLNLDTRTERNSR